MIRFAFGLSLLLATASHAGFTPDASDCTDFGRVDDTKFCVGEGAGYFLDGELNRFAGSGASLPITIAEGVDLALSLVRSGTAHPFDRIRIVSERHFLTPLDFPSEVIGPFLYGTGSGNTAIFAADGTLATLLEWQANSNEGVVVIIEYSEDVNFEGFIGMRIIELAPPRDYGDAPAPYPTLRANNGAAHDVVSTLEMRDTQAGHAVVDLEVDGQPDPDALGDENTNLDDERGVVTPLFGILEPGVMESVEIFASEAGGEVAGFIDFNRDGDWDDGGEQIINANANPGSNVFNFMVPMTASQGRTYGRFRISTMRGLGPVGVAPDGEVEDHAFHIGGLDLGDAPDSYGTLLGSGGPGHLTGPRVRLGMEQDIDADGQPSFFADGDDLDAAVDDEDALTFIRPVAVTGGSGFLFPGEMSEIGVTYGGTDPGFVSAWIDFDRNGVFDNPAERIVTDALFNPMSSRVLNFMVPATADFGLTYLRLRAYPGAQVNPSPVGVAGFILPSEGEVEDHEVGMSFGLDFGDAPGSYATLFDDGGPAHAALVDFNLGAAIDAEEDGQPTPGADGDDNSDAIDDEDGVIFRQSDGAHLVRINQPETVEVLVDSELAGELHAWLDANIDGDFRDAGEKVVDALALGPGSNQVTFSAPTGALDGPTYMRFRYVMPSAPEDSPLGPDDIGATLRVGEVEDYLVEAYVEILRSGFEDGEGQGPR